MSLTSCPFVRKLSRDVAAGRQALYTIRQRYSGTQ